MFEVHIGKIDEHLLLDQDLALFLVLANIIGKSFCFNWDRNGLLAHERNISKDEETIQLLLDNSFDLSIDQVKTFWTNASFSRHNSRNGPKFGTQNLVNRPPSKRV